MNSLKKHITVIVSMLFSTAFLSAQSVDLVANVDQMPPFTNGQTLNYSITSTGSPYNALRIKLEYNPSVLQLNSLTPVYAFGFTPVNDISTPGLVKYEAASLSGNITTDEVIFTIEFEVLDSNQAISISHNYDTVDGTVVVNSGGNDILGTANDILLETLSVDQNNLMAFSIYPNPANNYITIKNNSEAVIESIVIYTIEGKMVLNTDMTDLQKTDQSISVDVTSLKNALYFMDIFDDNGHKKTYKVLVSH
ncbi:T9SS type A sorting domain-containing protein [Hanstruepera neustonica]|nr:T9SS type A sorting domain-containing protein [Hanstruepera neustonica]